MRLRVKTCNPSQLVWSLLLVFVVSTGTLQAQVGVSAVVDPNPIVLGQTGQLKITIEGSQQSEPPQVESNEYMEFAYRGPNTQFMNVNGKTTVSITHVFTVRPLRVGQYRIAPLTLFVDGKPYKTEQIEIEVVEQAEAGIDIKEVAWLEFDLPERNVYVGETISSELRMIMLNQATFPTKGLPQIEGDAFSITPIDTQPQITRSVKNGRYYDVYLWKIGITPVKAGSQTLKFKAAHVLRIPENRRNTRRDPFSAFGDPFFDSMFGRYNDTEILAESEPAVVTIESLPEEGRPESFNGAIGEFKATAAADVIDLAEGDPITLRIQIEGEGNFSQMGPPDFPANEQFKTYPPRVLDEQLDTQGYSGNKQFEYVVIPLSSQITEVPEIPFSYFNPMTGAYSEMNTPAIPVSIQAAVQQSLPTPQNPQNPQLSFRNSSQNRGDNLLPIKVSLGSTVSPPTIARVHNTLTIGIVAPIGILGLAYAIRRSRHSSQNDKERIRLKELDQKMAQHRQDMQKARNNNEAHDFYQAGCRVLQVALARQLGCNPESITEKDIGALWVPALGDDTIKESIQAFFSKVDALRYSGNAMPVGALEKEELELESILRQLGKKK